MTETNTDPVKSKFDFKTWYEKNKGGLSAARKKRYQEDPEYRAAALVRAKANRVSRPARDLGFHINTLKDAADQLGTTVWTIREWRRKDYFPEPRVIGSRLYVTQAQVTLLSRLKEFFDEYGKRTSAANKSALEDQINYVCANWNS